MKQIVSFSGGKDSTWMLLEMIRRGERIDEVVFFDTGWEFPQMIDHVNRIKELCKNHGIAFTTLHPDKHFDYWMFEHEKIMVKRAIRGVERAIADGVRNSKSVLSIVIFGVNPNTCNV